jgi:hypothetical protein
MPDGWIRQGIYDEPRLSEMIRMYARIGIEVRLMPVEADGADGCAPCTACTDADPGRHKVVYTKKRR